MIKQFNPIIYSNGCEVQVIKSLENAFDPILRIAEFELRQEQIRIFGKWVDQPRLVGFYGDPGIRYTYSGKEFRSILWNNFLHELRERIQIQFDMRLNSALVNYYRHGMDSMGLHSDDEKELGEQPTIVSVSYGATRKMVFRNKSTNEVVPVYLDHGDVLIMSGQTQSRWKHELPKEKKIIQPRLNVTFRKILSEFDSRT